jgi:hypothetical protein
MSKQYGYGLDSWAAMKRKVESLTKSPLECFDNAVRTMPKLTDGNRLG